MASSRDREDFERSVRQSPITGVVTFAVVVHISLSVLLVIFVRAPYESRMADKEREAFVKAAERISADIEKKSEEISGDKQQITVEYDSLLHVEMAPNYKVLLCVVFVILCLWLLGTFILLCKLIGVWQEDRRIWRMYMLISTGRKKAQALGGKQQSIWARLCGLR